MVRKFIDENCRWSLEVNKGREKLNEQEMNCEI